MKKQGHLNESSSTLHSVQRSREVPCLQQTMMLACAQIGNPELMEKLLLDGCDPNLKNQVGAPLLHTAVRKKQYLCVCLLLKFGADLKTKDFSGVSAYQIAVEQNDTQMKELLCKYGASPEQELQIQNPDYLQSSIQETIHTQPDFCEIPIGCSLYGQTRAFTLPYAKLFFWLQNIELGHIYESLLANGYNDLELLVQQMHSFPITSRELSLLGIGRSGDRYKFLIYLGIEAQIENVLKYQRVYMKTNCCGTFNGSLGSLEEWLMFGNLQSITQELKEEGYDLRLVLMQAQSSYKFNEQILKNEIKIAQPAMRSRFLRFLRQTLTNPMFSFDSQYSNCRCVIL